jgi:hypothetical protein
LTPPICCIKLVPAPSKMRRNVCCGPLWKTSRHVISPSARSLAMVVTMICSRSLTSGSSIGFATSLESTTCASCWRSFKHNHRGDSAKIGNMQAVPSARALWKPSGKRQLTYRAKDWSQLSVSDIILGSTLWFLTGSFGKYVKPKFIQLVRTKPKTRKVS